MERLCGQVLVMKVPVMIFITNSSMIYSQFVACHSFSPFWDIIALCISLCFDMENIFIKVEYPSKSYCKNGLLGKSARRLHSIPTEILPSSAFVFYIFKIVLILNFSLQVRPD